MKTRRQRQSRSSPDPSLSSALDSEMSSPSAWRRRPTSWTGALGCLLRGGGEKSSLSLSLSLCLSVSLSLFWVMPCKGTTSVSVGLKESLNRRSPTLSQTNLVNPAASSREQVRVGLCLCRRVGTSPPQLLDASRGGRL